MSYQIHILRKCSYTSFMLKTCIKIWHMYILFHLSKLFQHKITVTKLKTIFHFNKIAFHKNASTSVYIFQQKKRKMVFNINKLEIQLLV